MNPSRVEIDELIKKLGLSLESISRIRFGRGVAEKMSKITVAVIVALGAMAWKLNSVEFSIGAGVAVVGVGVFALLRIEAFSRERPEAALLEGGELLLYHQMQLAAKNQPDPSPDAQPQSEQPSRELTEGTVVQVAPEEEQP